MFTGFALALSERERRFAEGFPGRIGRFTDGRREIIFRWVAAPTRSLHPAAECFRAFGYSLEPLPIHVDPAGHRWSAFRARKGTETLLLRERIHDAASRSWTDPSSWYWSALFHTTPSPWWAITVAETDHQDAGGPD